MDIAVVIPVCRTKFTEEELISLRQLNYFLPDFPRIFVCPESLVPAIPNAQAVKFSDHFFDSSASYSKLLLDRRFYESFINFEYILIYQLDCLVFSDNLLKWCEMGYDYIGSPLFSKNTIPYKFSRVGNGGLSLRRVQGFLDVLQSARYQLDQTSLLKDFAFTNIPDLPEIPFTHRLKKKLQVLHQVRKGVEWYTQNYTLNEDLFWSDRAKLFDPGFKIAPIQTALQFSFERFPRFCFEKNHNQLPFGCHAWTKHDRAFWEPYLIL